MLRVAAAGDLHCCGERAGEVQGALAAAARNAELLLLAGDLTRIGDPDEASVLAGVCGALEIPTFAVLGNHDWHSDRRDELVEALGAGGIQVLEGSTATLRLEQGTVGIVGTKGFVGGFAGHSHLADFGEPLLRELYRATSAEVSALDRGLAEIAQCAVRLVVLHYSPIRDTLVGEPEGIWAFLGCDRMAAPILEHEPDLVVHGHAHAGGLGGTIGNVPVRNVSMFVVPSGFEVFELPVRERASATLH